MHKKEVEGNLNQYGFVKKYFFLIFCDLLQSG